MKKCTVWMIALFLSFGVAAATAETAQAGLRLGFDVKWVPLSTDTIDEEDDDDVTRNLGTMGFGARAMFGFEIFTVGLKINYLSNRFTDSQFNYGELNTNIVGRVGLPIVDLAIFAELGPAFTTSFDQLGFNTALGIEYNVVGLSAFELYVGLAGQYVNLGLDLGNADTQDLESTRLLVIVGFDFVL